MKVYRRFLLTNLCLLLIPILLLVAYSLEYFAAMRDAVVAQAQMKLDRLCAGVELRLDNATGYQSAAGIYYNAALMKALYDIDAKKPGTVRPYLLAEARDSLGQLAQFSDATVDVAVIQPDNEVIVSRSAASTGLRVYYGATQSLSGARYELWRAMLSAEETPFFWAVEKYKDGASVLSFTQFQPDRRYGQDGYYIVTYFYAERFLAGLAYDLGAKDALTMTDPDGAVLLSRGETGAPGSRRVLILESESTRYPFRLSATLDWGEWMREPSQKQILLYGVCALVLTLGVLLSAWLAKRNAAPIDSIVSNVGRAISPDLNYPAMMRSILATIQGERAQHETQISAFVNRTQQLVAQRLIERAHEAPETLEVMARDAGLPAGASVWAVLAARWTPCARAGDARMLAGGLFDLVETVVGGYGWAYVNDEGGTVCLLFGEGEDWTPDAIAQSLCEALGRVEGAAFHIGLSGRGARLSDAPDLYLNASAALDEAERQNLPLCQWTEDATREIRFAYSLTQERQIASGLKAGDASAVRAALSEIEAANFGAIPIGNASAVILFSRILGTIYQALNDIAVPEVTWEALGRLGRLSPGRGRADFQTFRRELEEIADGICVQVSRRQETAAARARLELKRFVEERATDPTFCLADVETHLGVSSTTAAQQCRDAFGVNFSQHLERLRLARACELLHAGNEPIAAIGERVGYASYTSFGRAFKRAMGVSPAQYRESAREKAQIADSDG